jgi:hypothetical protein
MRIRDESSGRALKSVLIMLTPSEARELADLLQGINPEVGDHLHVSDENLTREVTIAVYTPENLRFFSNEVRQLLEAGD